MLQGHREANLRIYSQRCGDGLKKGWLDGL